MTMQRAPQASRVSSEPETMPSSGNCSRCARDDTMQAQRVHIYQQMRAARVILETDCPAMANGDVCSPENQKCGHRHVGNGQRMLKPTSRPQNDARWTVTAKMGQSRKRVDSWGVKPLKGL